MAVAADAGEMELAGLSSTGPTNEQQRLDIRLFVDKRRLLGVFIAIGIRACTLWEKQLSQQVNLSE